ncbi:MAG: sensor domain-containing diguanylate cyclase [Gammaproteobacteria bacterium]|nr:sensor domain-containing diguanylate cyclase [Gammaproteobacteria bacterium]MDH3412385.1 sensor domain-containing diguanylate cyclase [Gammaproteobacteria bacterium]
MNQRDFVVEMDLESRVRELEQRLAALTEEAAKNEAILKSSQAREMKLLEADSLGELLRLLTYGLEHSYRLEAVSLSICDPCHEVRHLLWSDGISPDSVFGLRFVDAVKDLMPVTESFSQPQLGPYKRGTHRRLFPHVKKLGSVALMPLLRQQKLVGSLNFGSADPERFTREHATDFLHNLATIASFCMENAVNRARLVRSGITDVLTGMHNRRYLQDRLRGELASAQRSQSPLACLILDADHFKRVNDEHGHLVGDSVLREIARRILSQIRANDVDARFGGEEFAVLLPGTSTEVAMTLGERIREVVSRNAIQVSDDLAVEATISVGVASVVPARDVEELERVGDRLLADADAALYQAKTDGRNCVRRNA